ncbi:MAG: carboxylating nicotinate-nucleotide diphosphorylase [Candidatus Omnitrophota bacterium]
MHSAKVKINPLVKLGICEDIGRRDLTTEVLVPKANKLSAQLFAKEDLILCGLKISRLFFKALDKNIIFRPLVKDGSFVKKGKVIAVICGSARCILTAERSALNILTHLSGIATLTNKYVKKIKPYKAKIMDTRKTLPGLRLLEKYAVSCGGGKNHRFGLYDQILIKENHLHVIGGYKNLRKITKGNLKRIFKKNKVELEVRNLKEFIQALELNPDIIMLDNMKAADIRKAINLRDVPRGKSRYPWPQLEASGRINLKNIKKIAATGIEMISIGALTHSAPAVDISLEIK